MQGTQVTRTMRVVADLGKRPAYIPRYAQEIIGPKLSPLDRELPWFSWAAIDFLKSFCSDSLRVFEFGSGGSTLFFGRRCASVDSVEDHPEWVKVVRERVENAGLQNVRLTHQPFDFLGDFTPNEFRCSDFLRTLEESACTQGRYDIIVVDNQDRFYDSERATRPVAFASAQQFVKPGGIIIVDDSWRYPQLRTNNKAKQCQVFESVGPSRSGVTSTDVYYY